MRGNWTNERVTNQEMRGGLKGLEDSSVGQT
jgi:hypothetical protein